LAEPHLGITLTDSSDGGATFVAELIVIPAQAGIQQIE
jgi:hypothetical protein